MRHDVRGRGTLALPQRGFVLLAQGGSLMALTLNPEWGDMLYKSPEGATCVSMLDKT